MLNNVPVVYVIVASIIGFTSLVLNVVTIVRLAVVGAELRVLRQVLAGELAPKAPPNAWDSPDKIIALIRTGLDVWQQLERGTIRNRDGGAS